MAKLKYLVIHCTAPPEGRKPGFVDCCSEMPEGREVSSADIRKWHTSPVSQGGRGWKQVGYTDLFHLQGGVERLVNNNEDAQVDPWEVTNGAKGYNSVSRHIVYAGGVAKEGHPHRLSEKGTGEVCEGLPSQIPGCAHCGTQRAGGQSLPQFRCTEMAERNRY